MQYFTADRRQLFHGVPFELDGFAFPGNFLALASEDEIRAKGISIEPDPVPVIDLDALKASLKASVDALAENARQKYVTPGASMAMTYDRKRREALQASTDPAPDATKYPVLSASIGLEVPDTGNPKNDFDAISNLVISKEVQWAQLAKQIEILRLGAKKAVDEASTVEAAQAAAQVVWP